MQLANQIKEQVSLVDLLSRLGFQPLRTAGRELLYLSMIRDSDTNPSFSVNNNLGVWYDHGLGKGGNIIDFAMVYWKLPFQETLQKIMQVAGQQSLENVYSSERKLRKRSAVKIPHYEIQEVKELGNNPAITEYLRSRKIWEAALNKLKEIYYYVEDQKGLRKYFFAAGWQNELGAWEVRNLYFKGCLGHKAISFIPGDVHQLAVFEGYINYLSWLCENPLATHTVLVLNSISLLEIGIIKSKDFTKISLYFDHDSAGDIACLHFKKEVPQAIDCSAIYRHHNDYNEKLVSGTKYPGTL
jgi:hypothetical protein